MFARGTNPQKRLSRLTMRLSPIAEIHARRHHQILSLNMPGSASAHSAVTSPLFDWRHRREVVAISVVVQTRRLRGIRFVERHPVAIHNAAAQMNMIPGQADHPLHQKQMLPVGLQSRLVKHDDVAVANIAVVNKGRIGSGRSQA